MTTKRAKVAEIAQADVLHIWSISIDCPHCGESQAGWVADPREKVHGCDGCGKQYHVPADIKMSF
ncbi:hypothetical protein LA345_37285 (plasmid) [Burkholderia vietnamiensis]|nr:hypothetical protein [Burkholderia vietnamiensis]